MIIIGNSSSKLAAVNNQIFFPEFKTLTRWQSDMALAFSIFPFSRKVTQDSFIEHVPTLKSLARTFSPRSSSSSSNFRLFLCFIIIYICPTTHSRWRIISRVTQQQQTTISHNIAFARYSLSSATKSFLDVQSAAR